MPVRFDQAWLEKTYGVNEIGGKHGSLYDPDGHWFGLALSGFGIVFNREALKACGVDPAKVREVMMGGVAASRVLELFGKRMVERNFEAGIETRLYYKDLDIVLALAHDLGIALPAAALAMQNINALVGRGEGRNDLSALVKVVEGPAARRAP